MSSQPSVIPVVGVIGGIGSGKSSVTRRLREISLERRRVRSATRIPSDVDRSEDLDDLTTTNETNASRGADSPTEVEVIDADQVGHQVLLLPNVKDRIRERFGNEVFESIGPISPMISRSALARIVFGNDPSAEIARRDLERIVHPEIRSLAERQIRELRQRGEVAAILLDAAVLLEAGWNSVCNLVAFIDTPDALRLARVQAGRGWSAEELAKREASQWPLARKRAAADVVIDNSGSVDDAARQLDEAISNFGVR